MAAVFDLGVVGVVRAVHWLRIIRRCSLLQSCPKTDTEILRHSLSSRRVRAVRDDLPILELQIHIYADKPHPRHYSFNSTAALFCQTTSPVSLLGRSEQSDQKRQVYLPLPVGAATTHSHYTRHDVSHTLPAGVYGIATITEEGKSATTASGPHCTVQFAHHRPADGVVHPSTL